MSCMETWERQPSKASGRESVNDKREKLSPVSGFMDAGSGSDGERSGSASALISAITKFHG